MRSPSTSRRATAIKQSPGEIGGRLVEHAGRVGHGDFPFGAGGHVDIVEADRHVRHDPQFRPRRVEHFAIDFFREQADERVLARNAIQKFLARRAVLSRPIFDSKCSASFWRGSSNKTCVENSFGLLTRGLSD